jgi:uncharacterized protein with PIN domain
MDIVDVHGRMKLLGQPLSDAERPRPDIRRCPGCHAPLAKPAAGKARVEEVKK